MGVNATNAKPSPQHHPVPLPPPTASATQDPICQKQHASFATTTNTSTTPPPTQALGRAQHAHPGRSAKATLKHTTLNLLLDGQDATTINLHLNNVLFQQLVWVAPTLL